MHLNATSVAIPDGERFVVATVKEVVSKRHFPGMEEAIKKILHEETAHSTIHDAYNFYLLATGLPIQKHMDTSRKLNVLLARHYPLTTKLAICAAAEHFTAIPSGKTLV